MRNPSRLCAACALFLSLALSGCPVEPPADPPPPVWFTYMNQASKLVAGPEGRLALFIAQERPINDIAILAEPSDVSGGFIIRSVFKASYVLGGPEISMTFREGSYFPAEIAMAYRNDAIKGVFSSYQNGKYDVSFSDSTGRWTARFDGLALTESVLGMFAAGDPSLTNDQSARLRGIVAFIAVLESLRQQINAARWNGESEQGWILFNRAVNEQDLIAASRMVITSAPRALVTNGAGLSLNPTLAERLALAGREVVPQTHRQEYSFGRPEPIRPYPSLIHPPMPPPEPPQSGESLPKVSVKIEGNPVKNNDPEPFRHRHVEEFVF
ncbi:MAG: hypothetical protein FWE09_00610 [Treponema sp.]|nr:hypothetical protein [Treponema sp.]